MDSNAFFNSLDYIYIALMFISAAVGFVRGFTKDFLSSCAWFGSGFIAVFTAPYLMLFIAEHIENATTARCMAIGIAYLIILMVLLLAVSLISNKVKSTFLSGIDRAVGVLFGLFRGIAGLVSACIVFLMLEIPKNKYYVIQESKLSVILFFIAESWMPTISKTQVVKEIKNKEKPKETKKTAEIKEEKTEEDQSSIMKNIKDLIASILAKRQVGVNTEELSPEQRPIRSSVKHPYGTMSLMEARIKRRAQRKTAKLQKEIRKRLDTEEI